MMLVVQCKYKLKQQGKHVSKYGEIGFFAMGRIGSTLVNSALVISQTGFCIACKLSFDLYFNQRAQVFGCFEAVGGVGVRATADWVFATEAHEGAGLRGAAGGFHVHSRAAGGAKHRSELHGARLRQHPGDWGGVRCSGGLVTLVKIFLCLGLFFTYPVMLFPVFEVLQPMVACGNKMEDLRVTERKGVILRAGVVLFTAIIAAAIPGTARHVRLSRLSVPRVARCWHSSCQRISTYVSSATSPRRAGGV
ncbi:hypothetical protein ON010_g15799 [Phytophthora cinnamomi]|nr:hypothetical protein ON010_g15799 [Phytophthora cinnamomi]